MTRFILAGGLGEAWVYVELNERVKGTSNPEGQTLDINLRIELSFIRFHLLHGVATISILTFCAFELLGVHVLKSRLLVVR